MDACARNNGVLKREHARRIVRRSRHHARERQGTYMAARRPAILRPCVPLLTTDTLLRHQVRPGTLQTGRHGRFVIIDAYMVLGSRLDYFTIMAYAGLAFIPLQAIHSAHDRCHVAGLHSRHAMLLHELIGGIQVGLVFVCASRCLVMADDIHTQFLCIFTQRIHVIIRIGCHKGEAIVVDTLVSFPTGVPSFGQHPTKAVLARELEIPAHVIGGGTMTDALAPCPLMQVHRPPDTQEFHRLNPRRVFDGTGFIEVEHNT